MTKNQKNTLALLLITMTVSISANAADEKTLYEKGVAAGAKEAFKNSCAGGGADKSCWNDLTTHFAQKIIEGQRLCQRYLEELRGAETLKVKEANERGCKVIAQASKNWDQLLSYKEVGPIGIGGPKNICSTTWWNNPALSTNESVKDCGTKIESLKNCNAELKELIRRFKCP